MLFGALAAAPMARRLGLGRTLVLSAFGFGLEWGCIAFTPEALIWPATVASAFVGGFCGVTWNVNQVSLRQAITPPRMQGRMNASMRFIVWGTIPVGALLGGVLGGLIGLRETITIGAIGALVAFLPVTLSPVRALREMPAAARDEATGPGGPV